MTTNISPPPSAGRKVVFRSLVLVFLGLMAVGILLDQLVLRLSEDADFEEEKKWLAGNFLLIEKTLRQTNPSQWQESLEKLSRKLSIDASVIPLTDTSMPSSIMNTLTTGEIVRLFDNVSDQAIYYHVMSTSKPNTDYLISVSSTHTQSTEQWRWLSTVYYFSLLGILYWWLRPLVKDIERLNLAAARLGHNINAETPELDDVTQLNVLSSTFTTMANRLRAMIRGQKEMTNALSHELRTPLARVKFGIAVLKEKVDESAQHELANINADINEFDSLVSRMLDYAKLDDPSLQVHAQLIPMQAWLEELCKKARADERGIDLQLDIQPQSLSVIADEHLLSLAFSNLLNNALRYANSTIKVRCSLNIKGSLDTEKTWLLQIDDDGPGIPTEQLASIFKAFTRLDESRGRETGGHGLGLAVVERVCKLHRGQCSAEKSALGGACFRLQLPIAH